MTEPGSSVTRKISAVALSCRSGRSPVDGVMVAMREVPRSGHSRPDDDQAIVRGDDQTIELVVGVVGEREHHPVLAAFAGADLDAADDAVGSWRGRNLDAVAVGALLFQNTREVDGRRVTADADCVERARVVGARDCKARDHPEIDRKQHEALEQAQSGLRVNRSPRGTVDQCHENEAKPRASRRSALPETAAITLSLRSVLEGRAAYGSRQQHNLANMMAGFHPRVCV